jgi:hypothetical protein
LGEAHSELLPETQKNLNQPSLLPKQFLSQVVSLQTAFASQKKEDDDYVAQKAKSKPR